MTATAAQIAQLRRMTNETGSDSAYSDAQLSELIEAFPTLDERGSQPYDWDLTTTPPSKIANLDWIATYDMSAAASQVWLEKAAIVAQDYDFDADGGQYTRSQVHMQYMQQARYHASRRKPGTITLWPSPRPPAEVINQNS
jgi:hypothetical protein